jgi:hypothetical protein
MASNNKRKLTWGNERPPVIQHLGLPLARSAWNLRPTRDSPKATKPNWEMVRAEENNGSPGVGPSNVSSNNLSNISDSQNRLPTANEQIYGLRPTRLPNKAVLPPLRTSRKMPSKSALSRTENGGPQFEFVPDRSVRNTKGLEANIIREERRRLKDPEAWLSEPAQRQARRTSGSNKPAPGVMLPEYGNNDTVDLNYALNVTKAGFPLKSERFTEEEWAKWKTTQKERNWKNPSSTPIPESEGSTTPGGTPNTPGRRTRRREEHRNSVLERFAFHPSNMTPGGTIVPHNKQIERSGRNIGTPGFFSQTPSANMKPGAGGKRKTKRSAK